ncbi:hypothetical protein VA7868_04478 [Vibrio aerogenes CECT 7868]|uniref:Uncharacterized protein n=1 Tax=Vibrio aerogenes CECT 7868 TaxID=1216006 RepID=A0A1M6ELQ6_9VIBR|nr:hypothetical protein [Vibrio aerogenes]SHI86356.1 hypothetical protein VA7868_04478 [Vibrio aerogenes CECT 7868]
MESNNYQMAIDMLRCHLGLSEEEAKQQLGLTQQPTTETPSGTTQSKFPYQASSLMS